MDHAGALAHSADGHSLSAERKLDGSLFLDRVGGHDGLSRQGACRFCVREQRDHFFHAALDLVHRKLASDDAGGSHENLIL